MSDEKVRIITRRDLLKGAGALGAVAVSPPGSAEAAAAPPVADLQNVSPSAGAGAGRDVFESLTAAESDTLEAIVARLIPSDANGPGAREARAARYIDRALGGSLSASREAYRSGLAAMDRYARSSRGAPLRELSTTDQDLVLAAVESGAATGFAGSSAAFFAMVRSHTIQGTFSDPYYGGNANFIGWDLISYPGIRSTVTAADQERLEKNELKPTHRSAYDSSMFNKATVRLGTHGETTHGD